MCVCMCVWGEGGREGGREGAWVGVGVIVWVGGCVRTKSGSTQISVGKKFVVHNECKVMCEVQQ